MSCFFFFEVRERWGEMLKVLGELRAEARRTR